MLSAYNYGLPNGDNRMISRPLVFSQYQHVTDRQTDTPPIAKSRPSIAERDSAI